MKRYITILFLSISLSCLAQSNIDSKRDYFWLMGYGTTIQNQATFFRNSYFDFRVNPVKIDSFSSCFTDFAETCATISDENGNLLFYTNGVSVYDKNYDTMENGTGLNPGYFTNNYATLGQQLPQGALILPFPNQKDKYVIIHEILSGQDLSPPRELMYTEVDMSQNSGLGRVEKKNQIIFQDTLMYYCITACRHGNGRDWWIVVGERGANCTHIVLLDELGFHHKGKQCLGVANATGSWNAYFSPDGNKYARREIDKVRIMDFDRCNGIFSNAISVPMPVGQTMGGMAISPNSRYLYACSIEYVYQIDLWATDVAASMVTAAVWDSTNILIGNMYLSTTFYLAALAPDNKIYINVPNGIQVMHVINNPDTVAPYCDVAQHSVQLPALNGFTMPNFPHFRLGRAVGSACDTVYTSIKEEGIRKEVSLYPNPAQDEVHLSFAKKLAKNVLFSLRDLQGRVVFTQTLREGGEDFVLEMENLAKGMYFWEARAEGKLLQAGKLLCE